MNLLRRSRLVLAFLTLAAVALASPERWQEDIDAFVARDAAHAPTPGGVVFVGSSSIRMWTSLAADFSGHAVVNRGFGGSELADSVHFFDQLVAPHAPRMVVLYAGDNDLWSGKTPEAVFADFQAFCTKLHAAFPKARLAYLAIKPSPSRWKTRDAIVDTNALIAAECARDPRRVFVDVFTPMLAPDGKPRSELFLEDMLHMNQAGYALWTAQLAPVLKP